jgi:membrane associated rhomboid family serine protease
VSKGRRTFDSSQLRITRGALIVAGLQIGVTLVWLLCDADLRATISSWITATPSGVFHEGRVWALATSPFLETDVLSLLLSLFVLWAFVPTLERFWGTPRFYRFFAITSLAGTIAGTLAGLALGRDVPIVGMSPFVDASIVAFGILYARQPVQFFGVLPLTGRQLMFGFMAFLALFVGLQQMWERGAAFAAAMVVAALMTSKRASPGLAWKRWRIARARARLSVVDGGAPRGPRKKSDDHRFIN